MRLTTWNVNGIRNPFGYAPWNTNRTFSSMFDILQSDIVVMQELKIQRKDLRDDMVLIDGWDCYFSLPKAKKGYSGVGIYTRNATCAPIKAEEGVLGVLSPPGATTKFRDLPDAEAIGGYPSVTQIAELGVDPEVLDSEGRCVCLEFPAFVLFGVYSPANSNGLRDDFRYGFLCALDCRIRNLIKAGKNVVLVGDLNVSRDEIDTANGDEERIKAGLSHKEYISTPNRRVFNQMIIGGEVVEPRDEGREDSIMWDIVRECHPDRKGMYTHWEQKINARPGNFGSRIDFVLVSKAMKDWVREANIQEGLMGSDHCPVYSEFNDIVPFQDANGQTTDRHMLDLMNPSGYFKAGTRLKDWSIKNVPVFSGKLLPEFDKRRSIKDMFKRPVNPPPTTSTTNGIADKPAPFDRKTPEATNIHGGSNNNSASQDPATQTSPAPIQSSSSPGVKRKASETPAPKGVKRQKSNGQSTQVKLTANKGQQSLKGFFAAKTAPSPTKPADTNTVASDSAAANGHQDVVTNAIPTDAPTFMDFPNRPSTPKKEQDHNHHTSPHSINDDKTSIVSPTKPDPPPPPSPSAYSTDGSVHDPIAAKDSWTRLMSKPAAPLCEHGEPCKTMLTKKKGENQGRSFFMCARPLGPSGAKEKNSQWRCATFHWCSDFKK
ncbi:Endonuclease/exonuclease/phosphatase [Elsinoe ampelina]|uniref:DNA-(apurinic or apyrimidinic site) endonuclease 2 n=1 Tax=Elsinoe ampelina TaxID=302913 RepID=A0A6A6G3L6_9PEZI|nr:Endonuclease/exonuclease/phosphatase [Elsinoe ampelina]